MFAQQKTFLRLRLSIVALVLTMTTSSYANKNTLSIAEDRFITSYIDAINSNDFEKLKQLYHDEYIGCSNESNADFYSHRFEQELKRNIPPEYEVSFNQLSEADISAETDGAANRGLPYPVDPTHKIQLDYNKNEYSSVGILRMLRFEGQKFSAVSSCPNDEMLDKFREIKSKREKDARAAKIMFETLSDPLYTELKDLMVAGQKIQAWRTYSETNGVDMATAKLVLSNFEK